MGKLREWQKNDFGSKISNFETNENEVEKCWKKASFLNSATEDDSILSIHISAFENSIDNENIKFELINKQKNAKQVFIGLRSKIQNPFEFSRQQSDDTFSSFSSSEPEVSQYKASQRLFNSYEFGGRQICGSEAPAPSSNNPSSTPSAPAPAAPVQTPPPPPAAATPGLPPASPAPAQQPAVVNVNVQPVQSPPPPYIQQPAYVQQQAPPAPIANVYGCSQPTQVTCPSCRAVVVTRTQTSMSTIDIVMIILGIFLFCFLVGFILICVVVFCSPWSDVTHFCPRCGQFIGKA